MLFSLMLLEEEKDVRVLMIILMITGEKIKIIKK